MPPFWDVLQYAWKFVGLSSLIAIYTYLKKRWRNRMPPLSSPEYASKEKDSWPWWVPVLGLVVAITLYFPPQIFFGYFKDRTANVGPMGPQGPAGIQGAKGDPGTFPLEALSTISALEKQVAKLNEQVAANQSIAKNVSAIATLEICSKQVGPLLREISSNLSREVEAYKTSILPGLSYQVRNLPKNNGSLMLDMERLSRQCLPEDLRPKQQPVAEGKIDERAPDEPKGEPIAVRAYREVYARTQNLTSYAEAIEKAINVELDKARARLVQPLPPGAR